ncbi:hypothetical protein [Bradyrhizobium sp. JYMT SZCCT0428]|uniref:hypothetical protein n=1 Tax=Bradyrhizobium sp. JYMT SZCCT0428 TaxID=2807673 RepID=UPI001BAD0878|nr:hypothetical protein [Bradyrhizobium sp. JYMT SZCCT0428]MBR1149073.1 hypothetical protein [Bradyrhizobium sp. JYMT SZCCT0428]
MSPPEMRNPAGQGGATSQTDFNAADNATERDALQASRICRLYAVSFASAVTIARLCYAVGAP